MSQQVPSYLHQNECVQRDRQGRCVYPYRWKPKSDEKVFMDDKDMGLHVPRRFENLRLSHNTLAPVRKSLYELLDELSQIVENEPDLAEDVDLVRDVLADEVSRFLQLLSRMKGTLRHHKLKLD